jgi:DNA primase
MFRKVYDILVTFLGESKQGGYITGCNQYQWNCPSCAEEKGGVDNKYNLEISFAIGKFHCWSCDSKGNISYLISRYGGKERLKQYQEEIKSIEESKMYDLSSFIDKANGGITKDGSVLKLPKTFTKIDLKTLKSKKLKEYLNKRKITQDIIDRYNIGYTQWEGEDKFMRNRIIVPSYDEFGVLNYWVGRDFSGYEKAIKYKNCDADKKDIVFKESLINYNADIVLVEGIIDSIYLPNAIPLMGKFLKKDSELYRKLYKKSNGKIIICLDSDTTIEETKRIYSLLNVGRLRNKIRYIQMDNYKDFGEVYEKFEKKGIIELLKSAKKFDEIDLLV